MEGRPAAQPRPRTPVRTCVGCRDQTEKFTLLRVVAAGSGSQVVLVPDPDGRFPGRGAYLHPSPGCLDLAERRRAFTRALRRVGTLDISAVRRWIEEQQVVPADRDDHTGQDKGDTT